MEYNTKQKDRILNVIKSYNRSFMVKDLYNDLGGKVGLTTIYRLLDKLIMEGRLTKLINNNITYYQYLSECDHDNHFYLKCDKCGLMEHVDCDCIIDLENHILKNHKFMPNKKKIIINGICENCKE